MLHHCLCCDWSISDVYPSISYEDMIKDSNDLKKYAVHVRCPKCGAVVIPDHFEGDEIEVWLRLFSQCRNALFCYDEETYRPDCENHIFYPGCLKFLWRELYDIKQLLLGKPLDVIL